MFLAVLLAALAISLPGLAKAQENPASAAPPAEATLKAEPKPVLPVVYSQADPRWKAAPLGRGTIARNGCLITDLAMIAFAEGFPYDPYSLSRMLSSYGLILRDGSLVTSMISKVLPTLRIAERFALRAGSDIPAQIAERIAEGRYVLVKLVHGGRPHWVLALSAPSGDLTITDPNGGKVGSFTELYGSTKLIKEVLVLSSR